MQLKVLMVMLCILLGVFSEAVEESHIDLTESVNFTPTVRLARVQKTVDIGYRFSLVTGNV